jgi:hypothetical protein
MTKNDKRDEETPHQKGYANSKYTYENVINIIFPQGIVT